MSKIKTYEPLFARMDCALIDLDPRYKWYGNVAKFDELKNALGKIKYNLEVLEVIDS